MTTLILDMKSRTLYSDSRMTQGNILVSDKCKKVCKVETYNGLALVGFCGNAMPISGLVEDLMCTPIRDIETKGTSILLCYEKGPAFIIEDGGYLPIHEPFFCMGSGEDFARSAMALGKTPQEAIKFASRFDTCTGGKVQRVSFK